MNERTDTATGPILVTGGTGTLGRLVVAQLAKLGRPVRVLTRRVRRGRDGVEFVTGDLADDEGIEAAVEGTRIVVHCAGTAKGNEDETRHLVRAAARAGVEHLVYISVVGADRIPLVSGIDRAMFGYFGSKQAAERVVADSGLPWTTLRATQFHQAMLNLAEGVSKLPVIPVAAGFRFQPVDAGEVAHRLTQLALSQPIGLAPDLAGPRVYEMGDLISRYLRVAGKRRLILPIPVPGRAAQAYRAGANLSHGPAAGCSWDEFLMDELQPAAQVSHRA